MQQFRPVRRALLSVSDKTNILKFANSLIIRGVELLATNGTAKLLKKSNIPVTEITNYTGFPEIMNGRIKTLHPKIYGGILGRRGQDDPVMIEHNIQPIDMVIVNLYPFLQTIKKCNSTLEDAIDQIDIGGSAMLRAAAKNYKDVIIVVNSNDYDDILNKLDENNNSLSLENRFHLAIKAFEYSANYDSIITNYFSKNAPVFSGNKNHSCNLFPNSLNLNFIKKQKMRYGENSHQKAAFYIEKNSIEASIATAKQIQGKELSYNNIVDADTALECVKEFSEPACVIVKHSNPCGVATGNSIYNAYIHAYRTDPESTFGGIIAFNRELDEHTVKAIFKNQFVEVIISPSVTTASLKITATKQNVRILIYGQWKNHISSLDFKRVTGGLLVQNRDLGKIYSEQLRVVTERHPTLLELNDALFCWKVAKFVKSNAIVYGRENMTIGIGTGQTSRVCSAKIAGIKANDAGLEIKGCVMASDAFLPFRDSIDVAAHMGVTCVIQPGGSIRDNEVISTANEHDIAMLFTGMRHFRH